MNKTKIEWSDYSWPIVNGCRRISKGCGAGKGKGGCYAERLAATRLVHTSKYKGLAVMTEHGPRWTGETRLWYPDLVGPIKLRTPSRIFVADMGDLFYEGVSDDDIDQVFGVMWACLFIGRGDDAWPGHTFQVLTKRAERMRDYLSQDRREKWSRAAASRTENADAIFDQTLFAKGPHPRIHLGVSVEDQDAADERIPHLLATPAAVRFLSVEPMLSPITFRPKATGHADMLRGIDQVIVGAESGPGARPFDLEWARAIVSQCRQAGTAVFVKQLGPAPLEGGAPMAGLYKRSRKGNDMAEWPEDLRVREFPRSAARNPERGDDGTGKMEGP